MALRLLLKFVPVIPGPVPAWQQLASREGTGAFYTITQLCTLLSTCCPYFLPLRWMVPASRTEPCGICPFVMGLFLFISMASKFIRIGPGVGLSGLRFHPSLVDTGLFVLSNMPMTMLHREPSPWKTIGFGARVSGTYCVDSAELAAKPSSSCLCFLNAGLTGVCHHVQLMFSFDNLLKSPSAGPSDL